MEEATAVATAEAPSVDQSDYVGDALDQYSGAKPSAEPKAETPKPEAQPDPKAQQPKPDAVKAPEAEEQPDPFDSIFSNEAGEMDVQAFTKFTIPNEAPEITDLGDAAPEQTDTRSDWEKDAEEYQTYEQNLKNEVLVPLQQVADLLGADIDPRTRQALETVYAQKEQALQKHLAEFRTKKEIERQKSLEERLLAPTRKAESVERAKTNTNELVSKLPGKTTEDKTALFNHVLFSKEVGAPILDHYFREKYPDLDKMAPEARRAKADEFIQSVLADKRKLSFIFERAFDRATRLRLPKLLQRSRIAQTATDTDKRLTAQKHPAGLHNRTRTAAVDPWDAYRNSHGGADRV
jgi:hypothetical protein